MTSRMRILAVSGTTLTTAAMFVLAMRLAVRNAVPQALASFLVCATLLALVVTTFHALVVLGPCATDEHGERRDLHRRHGFWVVTIGICLALPTLGTFGLVDPWETHYAEVARE